MCRTSSDRQVLKPSETVNANALTIAQNAIAKAAASAKNAVAQEGAFA